MTINPNFMKMLQTLMSGANPQQAVMQMLETQAKNNPFLNNILKLAKNNQTQEIEDIARNIMKEKGLNFEQEFHSFKNTLGLK